MGRVQIGQQESVACDKFTDNAHILLISFLDQPPTLLWLPWLEITYSRCKGALNLRCRILCVALVNQQQFAKEGM